MAAAPYDVSVTLTTTGDITGDVLTTEPVLLVKVTGGTVAANDELNFYVDTNFATTTKLSWAYTATADDDFATAGKRFTLSPELVLELANTASPAFSNGRVYKIGPAA